MLDVPAMITTKAVRNVITIADIEALEGRPYDELIPARMLIDLLRATAHAHPDRPAITTVPRGGFSGRSSTMSHRDLYKRVVRAANFFDGLMQASGGGTIAFLGPIGEGMVEALLGAQTAGVASTINCLLGVDVIADLLAAENASVLVLSPAARSTRRAGPPAERLQGTHLVLRPLHAAVANATTSSSRLGQHLAWIHDVVGVDGLLNRAH
jgi:fatty-acyl-CoA synthase